MRYDRKRGLAGKAMRTSETKAALRTVANRWAPQIAAGTRVDSGDTQRSTHVESGHVANDGRPAVRIVQSGAPVPENFRQNRDYILRAVNSG